MNEPVLKISIEPLAMRVHEAKRAGKTQSGVAVELGVSPQYLSNVLSGRSLPSMDLICRACEVFACEVQDIIKVVVI